MRLQSIAKKGVGAMFEWPKLRVLMTSPLLRMYYVSYLSQAHNLENLLFLEDVQKYREKAAVLQVNSPKIRALAQPIIDQYVVTDAASQVICKNVQFFLKCGI
jgi:hypothetical protein